MPLELNLGNLQYKNENGTWTGIPAVGGGSGGGSGGEGAFQLISTMDFSTPELSVANAGYEFELDGVTEIVMVWENMMNETATASRLTVRIEDESGNWIQPQVAPKTGKTGTALNGYTIYKLYEGVGTYVCCTDGAISNTNYMESTPKVAYNLMPITSKFKLLKVQNVSTLYFAKQGICRIYVR